MRIHNFFSSKILNWSSHCHHLLCPRRRRSNWWKGGKIWIATNWLAQCMATDQGTKYDLAKDANCRFCQSVEQIAKELEQQKLSFYSNDEVRVDSYPKNISMERACWMAKSLEWIFWSLSICEKYECVKLKKLENKQNQIIIWWFVNDSHFDILLQSFPLQFDNSLQHIRFSTSAHPIPTNFWST